MRQTFDILYPLLSNWGDPVGSRNARFFPSSRSAIVRLARLRRRCQIMVLATMAMMMAEGVGQNWYRCMYINNEMVG